VARPVKPIDRSLMPLQGWRIWAELMLAKVDFWIKTAQVGKCASEACGWPAAVEKR
jgi:hypothetical protein